MAVEIRRMLLSPEELARVMTAHINSPGCEMPKGTVVHVRVQTEEPLELTATIQQKDGGLATRTIGPEHVVATVTYFCRENGIPVPRDARKTAKVTKEGQIAVDMVLRGFLTPKPKPSAEKV